MHSVVAVELVLSHTSPPSHLPGTSIVGALDMGGSSNQLILFNAEEAALELRAARRVDHSLFWSHSWLDFGAERVHQRVADFLLRNHSSEAAAEAVVPNPCGFTGHDALHESSAVLRGTGRGEDCLQALRHTLWGESAAAHQCLTTTEPSAGCGVDEVVSPPVRGRRFYAMSVYFYAFDCIRQLLGGDSAHFAAW